MNAECPIRLRLRLELTDDRGKWASETHEIGSSHKPDDDTAPTLGRLLAQMGLHGIYLGNECLTDVAMAFCDELLNLESTHYSETYWRLASGMKRVSGTDHDEEAIAELIQFLKGWDAKWGKD